MISDPLGDFICRLRNAAAVGHKVVESPFSKLRLSVAEVLVREGYLTRAAEKEKKGKRFLEVELAYTGARPRLTMARRVSRPSRRVYLDHRAIKPVRQGRGRLFLSTSRGVMTGREARRAGLGGEALFTIY